MNKRIAVALFVAAFAGIAYADTCPTLVPNVNVVINYIGPTTLCSPFGSSCAIGEPVAFQPAAFNYSFACTVHTFEWNFGDGSTATGMSVTHVFAAAGIYPVTVTITTPSQHVTLIQNVRVNVVIDPLPATWDFTTLQLFANGVPIPHGFTFHAAAIPEIVSTWQWDFGDGTTVTGGATQVHIYGDNNPAHIVKLSIPGIAGSVSHIVADPRRRAARH